MVITGPSVFVCVSVISRTYADNLADAVNRHLMIYKCINNALLKVMRCTKLYSIL